MPKKTPCTIPATPPASAIQKVALKEPDHQRREIVEYIEWQMNKGQPPTDYKVTHLERMKAEKVFGEEHVAWDVHTDEPGRWWVITGPTNLYSQVEFPSLDYTFSFHIGLAARVASQHHKKAPADRRDRLRNPWRRWETAVDALDMAQEAEDFQSVGMRCRETLVALGKALKQDVTIPAGVDPPKAADFLGWSVHIADHFAPGARNERIRGYLKAASRETWQLVSWLTHTSGATNNDAKIALDATSTLLGVLSRVVTNHEAEPPSKCPDCGSYQIAAVYDTEVNRDPPYVNLCESCGWNDSDEADADEAGPD